MSLHNFPMTPVGAPVPGAAPAAAPDAPAATGGAAFGRVLDLQEARDRRIDPIPDEVRDDMARASELVDRLAFEGRQVRFDTHRLTGRVVAGLCDGDGALIRQIGLSDVVDARIPDGAA